MKFPIANGGQQTQHIPQPHPRQDTGHFREMVCTCGCREYRALPSATIAYDPLMPRSIKIQNGTKFQCFNCNLFLYLNPETKSWEFRALELIQANPVIE